MKSFLSHVVRGVASALTVTSSPLYRYPYRHSWEGLRGDWRRIAEDITVTVEKFSMETPDEPQR